MPRKAQVSVVGFTIITLIMLITVSVAFIWGRGLIERSSNFNDLTRVENQMVALHNAVKEVANERSQRTVPFVIKDGILIVPDNRTIRYETFADLPESVTFNENRVIIGGVRENATEPLGPCLNESAGAGNLGFDDPGCLIQKGGGIFEIGYIILNDTVSGECFGIVLDPGGNVAATKGEHNILLTFNNTKSGSSPSCTTGVSYSVINVRIE